MALGSGFYSTLLRRISRLYSIYSAGPIKLYSVAMSFSLRVHVKNGHVLVRSRLFAHPILALDLVNIIGYPSHFPHKPVINIFC